MRPRKTTRGAADGGTNDRWLAQLGEYVLGLLDPEDQDTLEAAIAGSLPLQHELAALRRTIAAADTEGEALTPDPALRQRLLTSLDASEPHAGYVARIARLFDFSAARARRVLDAIGDPGAGWVEPGPIGVRLLHFEGGRAVADADCGLVELAPDCAFPMHVHRGDEWTLSLTGWAEEDSGRRFEPGDLSFRRDGTRHAILNRSDEAYVFAAVLFGGIHLDDDPVRTS